MPGEHAHLGGNFSTAERTSGDSLSSLAGSNRDADPKIAMIVPRGFKIRDEFTCPITRELMTDPVIASDGHTYDRQAIEQWIHGSSGTRRSSSDSTNLRRPSPKTGQPLDHLHLIPNHNLKRLLRDMIKEGGESLYIREEGSSPVAQCSVNDNQSPSTVDSNQNEVNSQDNAIERSNTVEVQATFPDEGNSSSSADRYTPTNNNAQNSGGPRIALVHSKVLHCRCLGPPESDWNNRSFHLTESSETLLGGRRRPHEITNLQNFVQFSDATVSRRHFEVRFNGEFQLRDLGSAGGTFVRIPQNKGISLTEGTMIMLGKHQLLATTANKNESSRDNGGGQTDRISEEYTRMHLNDNENNSQSSSSVQNYEDRSFQNNRDQNQDFRQLHDEKINGSEEEDVEYLSLESLEELDLDPISASRMSSASDVSVSSAQDRSHMNNLPPVSQINNNNNSLTEAVASTQQVQTDNDEDEKEVLTLLCFAPEGTPIQNRSYKIYKSGATLGRRQGNTISFSQLVYSPRSNGVNSHVGIDSSISGEHATIKYDDAENVLKIYDGVNDKGSTNGTWIRLSPMHEESEWFPLDDKSEILIGTVRFQVCIEEVVVEKDLYD